MRELEVTHCTSPKIMITNLHRQPLITVVYLYEIFWIFHEIGMSILIEGLSIRYFHLDQDSTARPKSYQFTISKSMMRLSIGLYE